MNHLVLGEIMREGTLGAVKPGVHTFTGEKVVVRILEKD